MYIMSVQIIVGGQYGSEGKGKVAAWYCAKVGARATVRVGGPNSGHTVFDADSSKLVLRMLPAGAVVNYGTEAILPAGSYINVDVLLQEIKDTEINPDWVKIDPNAFIISDSDKEGEFAMNLEASIGSTLSGTGMSLIRRISRVNPTVMAKDIPELSRFITDTKQYMRTLLNQHYNIVIEGTQGYGLSNYHSDEYPYVTARDTTAAGFLSETGLSPMDVDHIIMVIRAFPIRVGGHSGEMKNEIDWETITKEAGAENVIREHTSVTHRVRRVARFDQDIVKAAIVANNPDIIVMNHVDYISADMKSGTPFTDKQITFIREVEQSIGRRIDYCGYGPMTYQLEHCGRW